VGSSSSSSGHSSSWNTRNRTAHHCCHKSPSRMILLRTPISAPPHFSVAAHQVVAKIRLLPRGSDIKSFSAKLTALTEDNPPLVTTDEVDSLAQVLVESCL